ncbi:MAG TPA: ABC transporter ATP-binding protein [Candidatus Saccharimonadales bacterium]|nr:ABC transporter ATP-binding protein [Candidatus Saccharimonadales bacterium]
MKTSEINSQHVVRYFWRKAKQQRRYIIPELITLPINVLANQVIPPIILADVLNRLAKHDFTSHQIWHSFGTELVLYAVLVLFGSWSWRIIDSFQWRLEGKVEKEIAEEVFNHLLSQSARVHADHFTGSLVSQTNKLMGSYIRLADTTIFNVLPLVFGVTFSIIILLKVAPLFALILFVFALIYGVSAVFVTRKVRNLGAKHAEIESKQTGLLADAITNALAVKSFAGGRREAVRFENATSETYGSLIRFGNAHQRQQLYFGTMLSTISALSLVAAVVGVMVFNANVATVFLIFNYTAMVAEQLFAFSNNALRNYNRALGDARDMVAILSTEPEVLDPEVAEPVHISRGDISFSDVTFKHGGAKSPIFKKFNLHIKPGEKVGLVGHSGSGKTTFTRLLLRFSDIDSGAISIDGQNIAAITQDDLRSHIAYVPQEPMLFHRSIEENISYGDPAADPLAIREVARLAHADEFIDLLPDGYDTLVGERGVKLSGGQRQRIAIARAMLKNAPVLALDEATSALDSESEILIQDALWKLMEGRTAIVIAHRLSTIQHMDRIVVLSDGKIAEQGSHKELLHAGGVYAKLWEHQSGGFIEE